MSGLTQLAAGCNAFRLQFDSSLLAPIRDSFEQYIAEFLRSAEGQGLMAGGQLHYRPVTGSNDHYHLTSYGIHPLLWISCDDIQTHAVYEQFFRRLGLRQAIAELVDCDRAPVVYCGFLVVGNRSVLPNWHVDFASGANAYTLVTPLEELHPNHGHLRYRDADGEAALYRYRLGEALVLGEGFLHATQPYRPNQIPRVLLSLTFGTDRMCHWGQLSKTIATQSRHLMLPNRKWVKADEWCRRSTK